MNARKLTLFFMLLGMIAIAATTIYYHFAHDMVQETKMQMPPSNEMGGMNETTMPSNEGGMSNMMNMSSMFNKEVSEEFSNKAGELMQRIQAEPNNPEVFLELALLFFEAEDYVGMLNFSTRASTIDPMSAKAAYLSGVAYSQLGEAAEAAMAFERSLVLEEMPATRYSLSILYIYNLDNKEKAKEHLQKALEFPNLDEVLKASIEKELAGL